MKFSVEKSDEAVGVQKIFNINELKIFYEF